MPPPSEWPTIGGAVDPDRGQQVADAAGVRAERVVAADRGRVAVAEQVGGDHRVAVGEPQRDLLPVARGVDHPVDQDDGRAVAGDPVDHPVAVQLDLPFVEEEGGGRARALGPPYRDDFDTKSGQTKTDRHPWRPVFANRPRQDGQGYVSGALLGGYVVEPGDGRRLAANAWYL